MRSPMLGELIGTLILILLGDGVNAAVLLKRSKAEGSGWMVITAGWAFAVLCGIFTAMLFGSKDGHLNPAITLAFAIENRDFSKVIPFAIAQIAGGFCGAVLVWIFYLPHWRVTEDAEAKRSEERRVVEERRHAWCLSDWSSDVCSSDLHSRLRRSRADSAERYWCGFSIFLTGG